MKLSASAISIPDTLPGSLASNAVLPNKGRRLLILTVFLLAVTAVIFPLFKTPILGIANNGDFGKVCLAFALSAPAEEEYNFVSRIYHFDESKRWDSLSVSTEVLLVRVALVIDDWIYLPGPDLDIRSMGIVHGVPFVAGLGLLIAFVLRQSGWRGWLLAAVGFFLLSDFMYVSYWNSFSTDAAAISFAMLAAGLAVWVRLRPDWLLALLLTAALCAMVAAKVQHAVFLVPLAVWILLTGRNWWPRWGRWFSMVAAAAVVFSGLATWRGTMGGYAGVASYNVAFYRILPWSGDANAALAELGLDSSFKQYSGTHSYSPGAPLMDLDWLLAFEKKVSTRKIAWYLARHPQLAWRMLIDGMNHAGVQRPQNIGNFEKSAGFEPKALSAHFVLWSNLKSFVFAEQGALYFGYSLFLAASLVWLMRGRSMADLGWLLITLAFTAMGVGCLGDILEVTRHLFLFDALLDGMLWAVLVLLAGPAASNTVRNPLHSLWPLNVYPHAN